MVQYILFCFFPPHNITACLPSCRVLLTMFVHSLFWELNKNWSYFCLSSVYALHSTIRLPCAFSSALWISTRFIHDCINETLVMDLPVGYIPVCSTPLNTFLMSSSKMWCPGLIFSVLKRSAPRLLLFLSDVHVHLHTFICCLVKAF